MRRAHTPTRMRSITACARLSENSENFVSGRIDLGLIAFITWVPVAITVIWWYSTWQTELRGTSYGCYPAVFAFLALPSGKLSRGYLPSSAKARQRLAAAKSDLKAKFWLPIENHELKEVAVYTMGTMLIFLIHWLFKVMLYGALSSLYRFLRRKTRETTSAAKL